MTHTIEPATTGRSRCKACGRPIERGELRFGERRVSFGENESTLWFHPLCAAYRRAEPLLEIIAATPIEGHDQLRIIAENGVANERLTHLAEATRAPTDRARCRHCRKKIDKNTWRLALVLFEEFRFAPTGFIHASCAGEYFGTKDLIDRVQHFSPELSPQELEEVRDAIDRAA